MPQSIRLSLVMHDETETTAWVQLDAASAIELGEHLVALGSKLQAKPNAAHPKLVLPVKGGQVRAAYQSEP